jgi:hypothetical protein
MAKINLVTLKSKFETGDVPTGSDFVDLIDTLEDAAAVQSLHDEVITAIDLKADKTYVDTAITGVDLTAVNNAIATKANITDVNTALNLKANVTDLTSGLSLKADAVSTTVGLAQKQSVLTATTDISVNNIDIHGNIVPAVTQTQSLGTVDKRFKDAYVDTIHIASNTLYLGDTPVLGTDQGIVMVKADPGQSINMKTTGVGISYVTSENGVELSTSGLNAEVKVQSVGSGGRVTFGATSQMNFTAPNINMTGALDVTGDSTVDNLTVSGTLTVNGSTVIVNAQTVEVTDNIILLNKGQVGSGVTAGQAGLRVDRGDAPDYMMVFDETEDMFQVGMLGNLETIASQPYVTTAVAGKVDKVAGKGLSTEDYSTADKALVATISGKAALAGSSAQAFATGALTVTGAISTTSGLSINTNAGNIEFAGFYGTPFVGVLGKIAGHNTTYNADTSAILFTQTSGNLGAIELQTGAAGAMSTAVIVNSSGNVGIGTTSPTAKLQVALTGTANLASATITKVTDFAESARFGFNGLVSNGDGAYFGMGANGSIPAGFGFFREAADGWETAIAFYTNNITSGPNGVAAMQEKMRLTSAGNLLIGTATNSGRNLLQVAGGVEALHMHPTASTCIKTFMLNGSVVLDTGIKVNAGYYGGSALMLASYHSTSGDATQAATYCLRFCYDGDFIPGKHYLGGNGDFITVGVTGAAGSKTLTLATGATGACVTIFLSGGNSIQA